MEKEEKNITRQLGLRPDPQTLEKLRLVRRLLMEGFPANVAVKVAGIGWKNYYKCTLLIYIPRDSLVKIKRSTARKYGVRVGEEGHRATPGK